MHAVGFGGERHVDAIVDDERHVKRRQRLFDRPRLLDHGARLADLIAQLDERGAALGAKPRQIGEIAPAGALRIDDGIEAKIDRHHKIPVILANVTPYGRARAVRWVWYKLATRLPEARMIPFFVQIKCQLGKSYEVANKLADAEIASEIYSTAGDFDLLVKFYVDPSTDIGHFVAERVQSIPGIADTRTIITFKAFGAGT